MNAPAVSSATPPDPLDELPRPSQLRQDRPIDDTTTSELTITHRSEVTEDQIDHLGHMNVRFYGVNAAAGTAAILDALGAPAGVRIRPVDIYTRHHREQLLGAPLVVRSGVVEVLDHGIRIYHELANEGTGALAATFVHRVRAENERGEPIAFPTATADAARAQLTDIPAHGSTRSISLATDPVASAPTLATLRTRDLAMRKIRAVSEEECNADGTYIPAFAPMLTWGGEPANDRIPEMVHEGPDGLRMGWASMETRMLIGRLPRLGDRIQSFSAVIALADKTSHRIQWAYDVDRGDLLTTFEVVNLAFDIGARGPMSIPAHIRESETLVLNTDLAPRAASSRRQR